MSIILKNATYINWQNFQFSQTNLLINEGIDASIHHFNNTNEIRDYQKHQIIDCLGKYVIKSFVVGHHHAYSALATGMPAPVKQPQNFLEILKYIWWKLDKALDKETIEISALITAIACAKAGSTFIIDHHASPNYIEGSLKIVADAFEKVGISHLLCYEISDRDGLDRAEAGLHETDNFLNTNQGLLGLHASFTVGNATMKKAADLISKYQCGVHIHVAEDAYDQQFSLHNYGYSPVERLDKFGMLNSSQTILAHCIHLEDDEREIISKSKAYIAVNTESNLNNKVGNFNSKKLGNRIFLGTDGMHSDMIRSAQWNHFAGQNFDNFQFGEAYKRSRNVHQYIENNNFKGDGENNLIVFDYSTATPFTSENFMGHFLFGFNSKYIEHVISNGKLIVKNKIAQTVNEQAILEESRLRPNELWERFKKSE